MGANIEICGKNAIIKGVNALERQPKLPAVGSQGRSRTRPSGPHGCKGGAVVIKRIEHMSRGDTKIWIEGLRSLGWISLKRKEDEDAGKKE